MAHVTDKQYFAKSPANKEITEDRVNGRNMIFLTYNSYADLKKDAIYSLDWEAKYDSSNKRCKNIEDVTDSWVLGEYTGTESKEAFEKGIAKQEVVSMLSKAKLFEGKKIKVGDVIKRRKKFNEYDGEVNIDKAMGGSVDFFEKKVVANRKDRIKSYYIEIGLLGGNSSKVYYERITKVLKNICLDILKGKTVEVFGCLLGEGLQDEHLQSTVFPIKKPNERLDLHLFAGVTYPAFFRHYIFSILRCGINKRESHRSSLGRSLTPEKSIPFLSKKYRREGYFYHVNSDRFLKFYEKSGKVEIEQQELL